MITVIKNRDDKILHVEVDGRITKEDVLKVAELAEEKIQDYGKIRGLIILRDFHGYTIPAFFEDLKFGLTHSDAFSHLAICGDNKLEEFLSKLSGLFMKGEIRYFDIIRIEEAINWIEREKASVY